MRWGDGGRATLEPWVLIVGPSPTDLPPLRHSGVREFQWLPDQLVDARVRIDRLIATGPVDH